MKRWGGGGFGQVGISRGQGDDFLSSLLDEIFLVPSGDDESAKDDFIHHLNGIEGKVNNSLGYEFVVVSFECVKDHLRLPNARITRAIPKRMKSIKKCSLEEIGNTGVAKRFEPIEVLVAQWLGSFKGHKGVNELALEMRQDYTGFHVFVLAMA